MLTLSSAFVVVTLNVAIVCQAFSLEKGWYGLLPLESDRSKVEAIFGEATGATSSEHRYQNEDVLLRVVYSHEDICADRARRSSRFDVPVDTVLEYIVVLRNRFPITDLKWEKDLYKKEKSPHVLRRTSYRNVKDGVSFETVTLDDGSEIVESLQFFPSDKLAQKYRCAENQF